MRVEYGGCCADMPESHMPRGCRCEDRFACDGKRVPLCNCIACMRNVRYPCGGGGCSGLQGSKSTCRHATEKYIAAACHAIYMPTQAGNAL